MYVFSNVFIFRYSMQHFVCNIFRTRSRKTNPEKGRNKGYFFQQVCKSNRDGCLWLILIHRSCPIVHIIITINILTEQYYFPEALFNQIPTLPDDGAGITASFPSPCKRNNTESAHIVAASHDAYKCS